MSEGPRTLHCWADKRETLGDPPCTHGGHDDEDSLWDCVYGNNATCMLEDGHGGDHEWTPDSAISIAFASAPEIP